MPQSEFYVDKTSHTFADALAAFGLARVVKELQSRANGSGAVHLEDRGGYYLITGDPPIDEAWLEQERVTGDPFFLGAPLIRTQKNRGSIPEDMLPAFLVDYEEVRDQRNAFFEALDKLPKEARQAQYRGEEHRRFKAWLCHTLIGRCSAYSIRQV